MKHSFRLITHISCGVVIRDALNPADALIRFAGVPDIRPQPIDPDVVVEEMKRPEYVWDADDEYGPSWPTQKASDGKGYVVAYDYEVVWTVQAETPAEANEKSENAIHTAPTIPGVEFEWYGENGTDSGRYYLLNVDDWSTPREDNIGCYGPNMANLLDEPSLLPTDERWTHEQVEAAHSY